MKCERCGKDDAVVKITRIEPNGRAHQVCLCQPCAAEASPHQKKAMEKQVSVDMLLKQLLTQQKMQLVEEESAQRVSADPCPSCGLDFAVYKATYMLGCPDCYEAFSEALEEDLERFHRAKTHVGTEAPMKSDFAVVQERLQAMRDELKSAIEYEDFDRAAYLRDEIARLEKELQQPQTSPTQEKSEPKEKPT